MKSNYISIENAVTNSINNLIDNIITRKENDIYFNQYISFLRLVFSIDLKDNEELILYVTNRINNNIDLYIDELYLDDIKEKIVYMTIGIGVHPKEYGTQAFENEKVFKELENISISELKLKLSKLIKNKIK